MSEPRDELGITALEAALVDLGTAIDWPATPDLTAGLRARIAAAAQASGTATVPGTDAAMQPEAAARRRPVVRSLRRSLLLAAALVLLVVGAALAVRIGLDLLTIEFRPAPTAAPTTVSPSASGASASGTPDASGAGASPGPTAASPDQVGLELGLGRRMTLEAARSATAFPILVPAALGEPDAVFLGGPTLRNQVSLVYAATADHPPSAELAGGGVLVTENRGRMDRGLVRKVVDIGLGTAQPVEVGGNAGYWLSGTFHGFWYLGEDGTIIDDSARQVGDTLVWEDGDRLYRIEGARGLDDAMAIAASMR